jgi:hypothetical protein
MRAADVTIPDDAKNLKILYESLMPVLSRATVGDFRADLDIEPSNDQRVNEILMGVQVLFDVINEKIDELESAKSHLAESRDRSLTLLDEVLKKSIDK